MVKEKCPCSFSDVWKIPTGYINKVILFINFIINFNLFLCIGNASWRAITTSSSFNSCQSEDLFTGAVREVKEETGVRKS